MDINSLLSPDTTPASPTRSPLKHVARTLSGLSRPTPSPLSRSIQPPSSIPAHIRSPSQALPHSSPLISPVPATAPQFGRTTSMEQLADLASMQSHQPLRNTPPSNGSRDSESRSLHQITSNPRASFDIAMVETPKPLMRGDFTGTSLPSEVQQRLGELVGYTQETPSAYESHIEIIKTLHRGFIDHIYPPGSNARRDPRTYDLLGELRQARESMYKLFAVGEDQWLDWLEDESILAQSAEERVEVVEKCRKAVEEEYGSSRLWSNYTEWIMHCYDWAHDADHESDQERLVGKELFKWENVLQVFDQALEETKWDIGSGNLVWDKYIRARFPQLDEKMQNPESAMQLFKDRLRTPHSTWDQTFQTFSSFVSANYSDDYENIMSDTLREASWAKQIWSTRDTFESSLTEANNSNDKYAEYQSFMSYIDWEKNEAKGKKRTKGKRTESQDLDFVNALFQRAELRIPSLPSLWESHIEYMISKHKSGLVDVLYRATKHCPWSGSLWKQYLLSAELADLPYHEIESIKHNATKTGMLEAAGIEEVIKIHDSWCGYLLRRTRRLDATEEDSDVAEMGIRTSMEAVSSLASKMDLPADFDIYFRLQRKYIEYLKGQGRLDNARNQFDDSIPTYGKHYRFWLRFYEFEIQKTIHMASLQQNARDGVSLNSSAPFAIAILKQGLEQQDLDYPEYLIEALQNHCEDYEDAEELQHTLSLIDNIQKKLTTRRQIEAEEAKQSIAQSAEVVATERTEVVANGLHIGKRKRTGSMAEPDESFKRMKSEERVDTVEDGMDGELKRDREHASVLVQNLPENISETRIRQYFSNCGILQSLKTVQDEENSVIIEFREAEEAQYALSRDGQDFDGSIISVILNTGSTIFVANFPATSDETFLRNLFNPYGEIISLRLPSLQGNKRRRFCYIEFKTPEQAQSALELDKKDIEGLEIVVKISNPSARQSRAPPKNEGRTIFVGQLPFKATEDEVRNAFSKYGKIETIKMPQDANSKNRNKGIAFIAFAEETSANSALSMNEETFQGRVLKVNIVGPNSTRASSRRTKSPTPQFNGDHSVSDKKPAPSPTEIEERRQRTIAVCDVPDTVNESRIRALAEKVGQVRKVILKTNHQGALIEFENISDAGKASIELDGMEIAPGRKIRVTTEQEMYQQTREKKTDKLGGGGGSKAIPKVSTVPVKRPAQPGTRRGGHLGQRSGVLVQGKSEPQQNGEGGNGPKSNADFRAMLN